MAGLLDLWLAPRREERRFQLEVRLQAESIGHGSKSRLAPREHPNPHSNRPKWVVHLPQNGTTGLDHSQLAVQVSAFWIGPRLELDQGIGFSVELCEGSQVLKEATFPIKMEPYSGPWKNESNLPGSPGVRCHVKLVGGGGLK